MRTSKRILLAGLVTLLAMGIMPAEQASAATRSPSIGTPCCRG